MAPETKNISEGLPPKVRELLQEMDRQQQEAGLKARAKVLERIGQQHGVVIGSATVTRWRAGEAFPPRDFVRWWAEACRSDADVIKNVDSMYDDAEVAYNSWRKSGRTKPDPDPTRVQARHRGVYWDGFKPRLVGGRLSPGRLRNQSCPNAGDARVGAQFDPP